ncbi:MULTISPECIES: glutamine synthetase [Rhodobacterales]|uniref:glutamine synthetase n=1 Tax=Rhodobacterales TaxID=204455 RepID=UPI00215DB3CE|nr:MULTISPECIES: glutamine synthetase [Rhodobacterales]
MPEGGQGQFEFNLLHIDDALLAADHAVYFKQIVKTCARKHDLSASFMAKPFLENSGCEFHVHFSLLDAVGRNVFDDGTEAGTPLMKHPVAGLIDSMAEMTLFFCAASEFLPPYGTGQFRTHQSAMGI